MIGRKALRIGLLAGVAGIFTIHGGFNDSNERGAQRIESTAFAMKSSLGVDSCGLAQSVIELAPGSRRLVHGMIDNPTRRAEGLSEWCYGYIPNEPSQCVEVRAAGTYVFEVADAGILDSMLMLRSPRQQIVHCDDDSAGDLRPRLEVQLMPGTYEIYVGAYNEGESGPFALSLSSVSTR